MKYITLFAISSLLLASCTSSDHTYPQTPSNPKIPSTNTWNSQKVQMNQSGTSTQVTKNRTDPISSTTNTGTQETPMSDKEKTKEAIKKDIKQIESMIETLESEIEIEDRSEQTKQ